MNKWDRFLLALSALALGSCVSGTAPNGVRLCEAGGGSGTVIIRSAGTNPTLTFELLKDGNTSPIRETIAGGASRTLQLVAGSWTFTVVERNFVQRFEVVACETIQIVIGES